MPVQVKDNHEDTKKKRRNNHTKAQRHKEKRTKIVNIVGTGPCACPI